ncbi:MAG: group II intron reverse transcriptase/maturase [Okeania sp. SIO3I5]|uniref:reverse transcriptase N-terminal domain-containing protein n=1 Tax=Okeania sp. SIO3I5 TaxID=2607805 RepID=UPI0013B5B807|nr:reverse transcriptase N-terminal domain-containing protein [Okeania sp. SIO3I5]NEQ37355.1 group II intron reverse transcriptase/maturase [Okeania sp. SIO3I5]
MSNTSLKTTGEWKEWREINWLKVERRVFKLRKRIYMASQRGDVIAVRKLQKTLIKSWYGRLLAVRRVSQSNQGEKTAGIIDVQSLSPEKCFALAKGLKLNSKVKPIKSSFEDFALQILVKIALEKQWEAKFELYGYGFRLGESCRDAIKAIVNCVKFQPKYVLKADITKCFDCLDYEQFLKQLDTYPNLGKQIRVWLKDGLMDGKELFLRQELIFPLLANIVFYEIEAQIKHYAETFNEKCQGLSLIRYAGDLAIAHEDIEVVQKCQDIITGFLSELFLELKPSQIRISHTLYICGEEELGFDFLGFNIRQYEVSKNQSKLGFKTNIKPSLESIRSHYSQISEVIDRHKSAPQVALIRKLNSLIKIWVNYYSGVVNQKIFQDLDSLIFQKLWSWAKRRHPNKNNRWICQRYWQTRGEKKRVFSTGDKYGNQVRLLRHANWIYQNFG